MERRKHNILFEVYIIIYLANQLKTWLQTIKELNKLARNKICTETNSFCLHKQEVGRSNGKRQSSVIATIRVNIEYYY